MVWREDFLRSMVKKACSMEELLPMGRRIKTISQPPILLAMLLVRGNEETKF